MGDKTIRAVFRSGVFSEDCLSEEEMEDFVSVAKRETGGNLYEFLYSTLGDKMFLFLDVFAGEKVKVPKIEQTLKFLLDSKIERALKDEEELNGSVSDEAVAKIAERFCRSEGYVRAVYGQVSMEQMDLPLDVNP